MESKGGGYQNVNLFLDGISLKQELFKFYKPEIISNQDSKCKKRKERKSRDIFKAVISRKNCFCLEIPRNPSQFSVYASIRQAVVQEYILNKSFDQWDFNDSGFETENILGSGSAVPEYFSKLPKMVVVGLCGIYELIRETHLTHPTLCAKTLQVLYNVLQSQQPESLKSEPVDIIESLYSLLMDLSQIHEPPPDNSKESCDTIASLACSSLISLVLSFGDTGKILAALSAMFISPNKFSQQHIKIPLILSALHKSVYAMLIGKLPLPTWFDQGIQQEGEITSFLLDNSSRFSSKSSQSQDSCIASDGLFLYILTELGLFKVGSGYQNTIMGHIYISNSELKHVKLSWIAFCKNQLLYKRDLNGNKKIVLLDPNTLVLLSEFMLTDNMLDSVALFSDGQDLYQIEALKDNENFAVHRIDFTKNAVTTSNTGLMLKLSQKKLFSFGDSSYDKQEAIHSISCNNDEEAHGIAACKDFSLLRLSSGRILYRGRGNMLGLKGSTFASEWTDLPIIKSPKIIQMSTGHEGYHVCLISEDGAAYFSGVSKRGEDGENNSFSKVRRAIKAVKPRRMMRVENKYIVSSSCNYATTALVTKEGEVFMFGKDAYHCDATSGLLPESKHMDVANISMGKAHVILLTRKGQVYSFGLNNKGQCGRDCNVSADGFSFSHAEDAHRVMDDDDEVDEETSCSSGNHIWQFDYCMVCSSCKQCTGFGLSCLNSAKDRIPGELCGCGMGDPGCSECGICKTCSHKVSSNVDPSVKLSSCLEFQEPAMGKFYRRPLNRAKTKRSRERIKIKSKSILPFLNEVQHVSSDHEQDGVKLACISLGQVELNIDSSEAVTQVSCGLHHTVVLTSSNVVFAFGSNQYGQLGLGDIILRNKPTRVKMANVKQVSAGSHHTVLLSCSGQIFTAGSNKNKQLGREINEREPFSSFHPVPGIGLTTGRVATWINASGDQTFFKADDSLVTIESLATSSIFANSQCIAIVPKFESNENASCLMVSRQFGSCKIYSKGNLSFLHQTSFCFDPLFDIVWSFHAVTQKISCFSIIQSSSKEQKLLFQSVGNPLDPLFSVPCLPNSSSTRSRVATNVLACLDVLTLGHEFNLKIVEFEKDKPMCCNLLSKEDYSVVNRFESHGGGWGYSGQSVEAIRFSCDTDVILGGFGLFGGRGEYSAKIKLFELGAEALDNEPEGELLAESEEVVFRCPPKDKHALMFDEPVFLQSNHWYVAWSRISGPSSDCGSNGQTTVFTDDQVTFKFRCSSKSNNGTDVNAGQIPQLLYKVTSSSNSMSLGKARTCQDQNEQIFILSKNFTHSVSSTSFESLISLLNWSWSTFCSLGIELGNMNHVNQLTALADLNRLVYVTETSLRLIRAYVNICYPFQGSKTLKESLRICECIADTRSLIKRILIESSHIVKESSFHSDIYQNFASLKNKILDQCQKTFKSCFHAFFPTNNLKWLCICELLSQFDLTKEGCIGIGRLLSCILAAMSHPSIKLSSVFTIHPNHVTNLSLFNENKADYPMLVNQMISRIQLSSFNFENWNFNEIVKRLIEIACFPFLPLSEKQKLNQDHQLVYNSSSLLTILIFQLVSCATGSKALGKCVEKPLLVLPSRFSRVSQGVFWNSGNGNPDAVCFSVDKPGIIIVGAGFYAGGEGTSTFELEILADHSGGKISNSSDIHWHCIESVKGSYDVDDCINDIIQVKFNKSVVIEENSKYALRLKNFCNRTRNGDDGFNKVKGPDGTMFTFSSCSLSINGTNHIRGQLPIILYQSNYQRNDLILESNKMMLELEAHKNLMHIIIEIFRAVADVLSFIQQNFDEGMMNLLNKSALITTLTPLLCAGIVTFITTDLHSCVEVLSSLSHLLPHVSKLLQMLQCVTNSLDEAETFSNIISVESDHPYKVATVSCYHVKFPSSVQWMVLEFDPQCCTSQSEDYLQLYLPWSSSADDTHDKDDQIMAEIIQSTSFTNRNVSTEWIPVYKKMSGQHGWPTMALLIPGNEVCFSLESSSYYLKDEKTASFGFKCQVTGCQCPAKSQKGLITLEQELIKLAAICGEMLIKKDAILPFCKEVEDETYVIENFANEVCRSHASLLMTSFPLHHLPSIHEALDGKLSIDNISNQKRFLIDFIQKKSGTSGGRLAGWLQPEPCLEPKNCFVTCTRKDLYSGWPCSVFIRTKDQFGNSADVSNLMLEARAILILKNFSESAQNQVTNNSWNDVSLSFGGHPPPKLDVPYHVTMKDKKEVYHSITAMKEYELYSFEELRYSTPTIMRPTESMVIKDERDGYYTASWTPSSSGFYDISVTVDGIKIGNPLKIHVKEASQGSHPVQNSFLKNSDNKYNKQLRQFLCKQSAGLRIRLHPSLQSEQIGIIENNTIISFTTQLQNDDGTWLKLSPEAMRTYHLPYNSSTEGWVIQYHQHFKKVFLFPVINKEKNKENVVRDCKSSRNSSLKQLRDNHAQNIKEFPSTYTVIKCGPSGHNVASFPKVDSSAVGKVMMGNQVVAVREKKTGEGVWIELSEKSKENFCFDLGGEAWCLIESCSGEVFLACKNAFAIEEFNILKDQVVPAFYPLLLKVSSNTNIEGDLENNSNNRKSNVDVILQDQTFQELVGLLGESQMNGNGITPPTTPKKSFLPKTMTHRSAVEHVMKHIEGISDSNLNEKEETEIASKQILSIKNSMKMPSENYHRSTSCSPPRNGSASKKLRSSSLPGNNLKPRTPIINKDHGWFSKKQNKITKLKLSRHEREQLKSGHTGPIEISKFDPEVGENPSNKVISPSAAECLRAMFAAFLWHKDVVQDAMACASFLKFCPSYTKEKLNETEDDKNIKKNFPEQLNDILSDSSSFHLKSETPKHETSKLPTLKYLVFFWEQLNIATLKVIENSLIVTEKTSENITTWNCGLENVQNNQDNSEWFSDISGKGPSKKETSNKDIVCDLCGLPSSSPVTYHMRQFHPGCGRHAGGQGYNSEGIYCDGWAGKCGDGGKHASTWYLICESCKAYYKSKWQPSSASSSFRVEKNKNSNKPLIRKSSGLPCMSQAFSILKNNAMFVLDLSFCSSNVMLNRSIHESDHNVFKCFAISQMPFAYLEKCQINNRKSSLTKSETAEILNQQVANMDENESSKTVKFVNERPKSIYEGYKFDSSYTSTTLFNLNCLKTEDFDYHAEHCFPFHRSISEMGSVVAKEFEKKNFLKMTSPPDAKKNARGLSLLNHPSFQLSGMIQSTNKWMQSTNKPLSEYILEQPFMKFCTQFHDLESLVVGMKLALCKATCRTYALQAFNWLLRNVTLQSCLHDLLWHFVSSLMLHPDEVMLLYQSQNLNRGKPDFEFDFGVVCRHPLEDIPLAESLSKIVVYFFHAFLQSLSDIMMYLPQGTAVQQMAVRCWSLRFTSSDHDFLQQSNIFKNISKILSQSEQQLDGYPGNCGMEAAAIESFKDMTPFCEIIASSHQQMVSSITDCSTETFWESGDDDRNKVKAITLICADGHIPKVTCLYVDNVRDHSNKVTSISVNSGSNQDEMPLDAQQDLDFRFSGWIIIWLSKKAPKCIKFSLRGPDSSLRVRQIKILGSADYCALENVQKIDQFVVQCTNCEVETLRVFKLLTNQVFKSLITSKDNFDEKPSTDKMVNLKEHMVGILFSQCKLTNMQKQVCTHILQAIKKETSRVREMWDVAKKNEITDTYCFELLSLVLALSGSAVGCMFIAKQMCLLKDLLTLLHTSSPRVQRQVVLLIKRLLVHVKPIVFADVQEINEPSIFEFSSSCWNAYMHKEHDHIGIIDIFLICIAKCLSVQVKNSKIGDGIRPHCSSIVFSDIVGTSLSPAKWWFQGSASPQLAEAIIHLLRDISNEKITEEWANVVKRAIAEPIIALSQLPENLREVTNCIDTSTFWLTLAALCVLSEEHTERLSSGRWSSVVTNVSEAGNCQITCENHDDGNTVAVMTCTICGNLCSECDRVLHLSKKTKDHLRHIFKEEKEAVKVDCHEGCGRLKLYWIMASTDSRNLKAVVEFRDIFKGIPNAFDKVSTLQINPMSTCRFCGQLCSFKTKDDECVQACQLPECADLAKKACANILICGHVCGGIRDEENCLPCLHGCRNDDIESTSLLKQDADDMCMICFSDTLSSAPAIQLNCGHVFHMHCCEKVLSSKWAGPRITFGFSLCPICKSPIQHPALQNLLQPIKDRFEDVRRKALMRLEYEGLNCSESIINPGSLHYNDPVGYAMNRYAYYVCSKCDKAYFGGEARCEEQAVGAVEGYDASELVCGACSDVSRAQICPKHGVDFLEYKCRYCCSVAVFFCFGTTHFCSACHDDFQRITAIPVNDLPQCPAGPKARQLEIGQCPLGVVHPSTGTEFALGCGICRNAHTF